MKTALRSVVLCGVLCFWLHHGAAVSRAADDKSALPTEEQRRNAAAAGGGNPSVSSSDAQKEDLSAPIPVERGTAVVQVHAPTPGQRLRSGDRPFVAALGDLIVVDVRIQGSWFQDLISRGNLPDPHERQPDSLKKFQKEISATTLESKREAIYQKALGDAIDGWLRQACLFLDNRPLPNLKPEMVYSWKERRDNPDDDEDADYFWALAFRLTKDAANREAWLTLLRGQGIMNRPTQLTVGLNQIYRGHVNIFESEVLPTAKEPWHQFEIKTAPNSTFLTSLGVMVLLASCGLWLALASDLLRDPTAPLNPAGRRPYSLGRCQTAWWLGIIAISYLFLWVVLGEYNTLTASELTLLGISAITGLGSIFIGSLSPLALPRLSAGEQRERSPAKLREWRETAEEALARKHDELFRLQETLAATAEATGQLVQQRQVARAQAEAAVLRGRIGELRDRERYFRGLGWLKEPFLELLREHGVVDFYRFQLLAWTLILGVVFLFSVFYRLEMPKFDATLLILLGISNGTYLGFKLPTAQQRNAAEPAASDHAVGRG